jgi:hypothetical protein
MSDVVQQLIKVWFGTHVIASYQAEPALADRYALAMRRRFAGLRVTCESIEPQAEQSQPLPSERLWELGP